ncbi:MAG: 2-oxoglutarate dehydrogenase E1 component, partial [Candidatus Omnitrophica bacterium]|nr:2-oxoglutarate dehydrogenase E1 component [Candidatus Omnitrophota bacterium]
RLAEFTAAPPTRRPNLQLRIDKLVRAYRVRGHLIARLDPLGIPRGEVPELDPAFHDIHESELDEPVAKDTLYGASELTVRKVLKRLRNTYCRYIGVQFMHIDDYEVKDWLTVQMETSQNRLKVGGVAQRRILRKLTDAVMFEEFIQKKYVGAKSFSLEGAESLIPLLDMAIESAAGHGIKEIVMAMAHRGRLNVLANIMGKSPSKIFREFEDVDPELHIGRGDVKYHLGYSSDWVAENGEALHLSLCFNPSHLEFVNPVALGRVRAKQDRYHDSNREKCMGILIHGDAAFAGQGIIQETLNMSQLEGYHTGGTLHVVVNNQIGFTTSPIQSRSNTYATAVAKMLQIPIFHVNGEDPEAVAQVVELAMDFRKRYKRDVIIDMYCYRLHGHNEGDEPSFTQPLLYDTIKQHKSVRDSYMDHLLSLGEVTQEHAEEIAEERRQHLEQELSVARNGELHPYCELPKGIWAGYSGGSHKGVKEVDTGISRKKIKSLLTKTAKVQESFHIHSKLQRILENRLKMAQGERPLDWAAAEALAMASLAVEGYRVRLSGQDSERGTFSHRHSAFHDIKNGNVYRPLQHLAPDQAPVEIFNSPLSEAGVLGFEYGYSLDTPDGLTAWEAQFGDFVNSAQVIIDQFIASAEDKWYRLSGIVLLLPHGFEGLGPEHSSARLERFLLLCAEQNIQVTNLTTPAQFFHLLRRQVVRRWRKPLVLMSPKSLLRHPKCVSDIADFESGTFVPIIPDPPVDGVKVKRILLCTGKIYYELLEKREELGRDDVRIVRLEQ